MKKIYEINNSIETIALANKLGNLLIPSTVILLVGDLSAGKTTFTKGIGQALGIKKIINSPTFTIVKTYQGKYKLNHLDLYRLNGVNEDFDLEEYFNETDITVVEWPFQVKDILPSDYISINLEIIDENKRLITIENIGLKYENIVKELD